MSHHYLVDQYVESCRACGSYPNKTWTQQFFSGSLTIDVSKLNISETEVISHAICKFETPYTILVTCENVHNEDKFLYKKILKALARSCQISRSLRQVSFSNCNFYSDFLSIICQGLKKTSIIDTLSFNKCKFSTKFSGLESLCGVVKNVSSISKFSLINCGLQVEDAETLKKLIMHQSMNRTSFMWQETLRFQEPELDSYIGLRHIILNDNPSFGDDGLQSILSGLEDDIWISGIEFENCGIHTVGAKKIIELLKTNDIINLVNIDRNPFVDKSVVDALADIMKERREREWNPENMPQLPEDQLSMSDLREVIGQRKELCSRFTGRRNARRKRNQSASAIKLPAPEIKEGSDWEQVYLLLFREMRERLQAELSHERERRLKLERRLKRRDDKIKSLRERLDSRLYMDEGTVSNIENSFLLFQHFLTSLQQAAGHTSPSQHLDPTGREVDSMKKIVDEILDKSSRSSDSILRKQNPTIIATENLPGFSKPPEGEDVLLDREVGGEHRSPLPDAVAKLNSPDDVEGDEDDDDFEDGDLLYDSEEPPDNSDNNAASDSDTVKESICEQQDDVRSKRDDDSDRSIVLDHSYESSYDSDVVSPRNKPDDSKLSGNLFDNVKFVAIDATEASSQIMDDRRSTQHTVAVDDRPSMPHATAVAVDDRPSMPHAPSETDEEKLKLLRTRIHPQTHVPPDGQSVSNHSSCTDVLTEDLSGVEDLSITTMSSL